MAGLGGCPEVHRCRGGAQEKAAEEEVDALFEEDDDDGDYDPSAVDPLAEGDDGVALTGEQQAQADVRARPLRPSVLPPTGRRSARPAPRTAATAERAACAVPEASCGTVRWAGGTFLHLAPLQAHRLAVDVRSAGATEHCCSTRPRHMLVQKRR